MAHLFTKQNFEGVADLIDPELAAASRFQQEVQRNPEALSKWFKEHIKDFDVDSERHLSLQGTVLDDGISGPDGQLCREEIDRALTRDNLNAHDRDMLTGLRQSFFELSTVYNGKESPGSEALPIDDNLGKDDIDTAVQICQGKFPVKEMALNGVNKWFGYLGYPIGGLGLIAMMSEGACAAVAGPGIALIGLGALLTGAQYKKNYYDLKKFEKTKREQFKREGLIR
ncbi:MAG: hypothetical protein K2X29_00015 [Candidatus Obscuribacterales bacterium]|nr:hypothetical protein [Candidatus Obscuribacterales bacterium]